MHNLTTSQLRTLVEAVGGLKDWPQATTDPRINHAIDCIVADEGEEPEYDEQLYAKEIEVCKGRGEFDQTS